ALVDLLEAPNAGAVEPDALVEEVSGQLADGDREVLPQAGEVDELQIDDLGAAVFAERERLGDRVLVDRYGGDGRFVGDHVLCPLTSVPPPAPTVAGVGRMEHTAHRREPGIDE